MRNPSTSCPRAPIDQRPWRIRSWSPYRSSIIWSIAAVVEWLKSSLYSWQTECFWSFPELRRCILNCSWRFLLSTAWQFWHAQRFLNGPGWSGSGMTVLGRHWAWAPHHSAAETQLLLEHFVVSVWLRWIGALQSQSLNLASSFAFCF